MKPSRLVATTAAAALAALSGCAPTYTQQTAAANAAYAQAAAQPGAYAVAPAQGYGAAPASPQATYGAPATYPQGTYGNPAAPQAAYASGYPATGNPAGYANPQAAYGPPNANGYYPRGAGQYPAERTFDVRQPYYGDAGYHTMGTYNDGEAHPLRLVSFAVAPVGYLAEWLVTRPIFRVVSQQDMAPIFSYTPQAGFDYETYAEGLSTGVTFEEPQTMD